MDEWTKSFIAGDDKAYKTLFDEYWKSLVFYASRMVLDRDNAEDIVQATFVALYDNRRGIESKKHARNFLFMVVKNGCWEFNRKRSVRNKILMAAAVELARDGQEEYEMDRVIAQVLAIIDTLPEVERAAIIMRASHLSHRVPKKSSNQYAAESRARTKVKNALKTRMV
jgi:RNA polymerase sigma-70 factor (ECF subfamily)